MKNAYIPFFALLLLLCLYFIYNRSSEGFDVKQSYRLSDNVNQMRAAKRAQLAGHLDKKQFITNPTYRATIPPRMFAGSHLGQVRGSMPPLSMQAVPADPMDMHQNGLETYNPRETGPVHYNPNYPDVDDANRFTDMVATENTKQIEGLENFSEDEIKQMMYEKFEKPLEYDDPSESLPTEDMSSIKFGKLPSDPQSVVHDRLIFVNQKRRNLEGSDFIRGDLSIVPDKRGWHDVSVIPHLDLRQGAVGSGVIGADIETEIDQYGGIDNTRNVHNSDITVKRYV
jgi:hypothetical protein